MHSRHDQREPEFEQLLEQLAHGSGDAAQRIVELYSGNILRIVKKNLPRAIRPKVDSIDIFQSVWLSVLANRGRLADLDSPQRLIAYLTSAARLKVLEKYRHFTRVQACDVGREQRMSEPVESARPPVKAPPAKVALGDSKEPTASSVAEAREALQNLIAACDEREEQVVRLRLSGLTHEEIAQRLNVSVRTVRRSLQKLLNVMSQ